MPPVTRRHKHHPIEPNIIAHRFSNEQMPVMYRIKPATENADFHVNNRIKR